MLLLFRITKDLPRFKDELDVMKFVCKDFWTVVYKKQVDNLRTNHQVSHFRISCMHTHTHTLIKADTVGKATVLL